MKKKSNDLPDTQNINLFPGPRSGGVWPLAAVALVIPRFMRDALYDVIAQNRYKWLGKYDTCPLSDPEFEDRFYP